jgi:hypothetical protein
MKIALITTTINVPRVLRLYRAFGADAAFFVAGDRKTPHDEVQALFASMPGDQRYLGTDAQQHWACSDVIGWSCVQRRNVALLEALKWGAEIIVTVDDDNIPLDSGYFTRFEQALNQPFNGLCAYAGWFDSGSLLLPSVPQRGLPIGADTTCEVRSDMDLRIGVAAGACLGDPDCSAITRIAQHPTAISVAEPLRSGIAFTPAQRQWTVFNTQNAAFVRELAPAMLCAPGIGRYDDIVASMVTQRIMRERGLSIHFGQPFVWQQRNAHDLRKDLADEAWGAGHIANVAFCLDSMTIGSGSVLEQARVIWKSFPSHVMPQRSRSAALAFLDDCEKVMR